MKGFEESLEVQPTCGCGQPQLTRVGWLPSLFSDDPHGSIGVGEALLVSRQSPAGVDHDGRRLAPDSGKAGGEGRVVEFDRPTSDEDGPHFGPESVPDSPGPLGCNPPALSGWKSDAPVERRGGLHDDVRSSPLDGQQPVPIDGGRLGRAVSELDRDSGRPQGFRPPSGDFRVRVASGDDDSADSCSNQSMRARRRPPKVVARF